MGKVLSGIGKACKEEGVTCIALSGNSSEADLSIHEIGITAFFPILNCPINLKDAMSKQNALALTNEKNGTNIQID